MCVFKISRVKKKIQILFKDEFSDSKLCLNQIQLESVDFAHVTIMYLDLVKIILKKNKFYQAKI